MKRKEFFQKAALIGLSGLGGISILTACGEKSDTPEGSEEDSVGVRNRWSKDPCDDLSGLTKEEIETRKEYEYTGKSPHEKEYCGNCAHYRKPEEGSKCATCELIPGKINPLGYCTGWMEAAQKGA